MVFRSVRAVEASAKSPVEIGVSVRMGGRIPAAAEIDEVVNRRRETGRDEAGRSGNRGYEEDYCGKCS